MFERITMINYARPLAERKASRKHVGPYYWQPGKVDAKHEGFGFYQASGKKGSLAMDGHGSICNLRLEWANDCWGDVNKAYSRLASIDGYYCDNFQEETMKPIVARLPNKRGFLAGWTMGAGMCASMSRTIYEDIEDAARAAHDEAEEAAEREREYQEEQAAKEDEEE